MKKWNIKAIFKEIIIGVLILFILTNIISYLRKPELDSNRLPHIDVQLIDGSQYEVKIGKPLVLHFWATWCRTCKLEAANIQSVSKEYEVLSIAVNSGDTVTLQAYMEEKGLTFNVVNDKEGSWAKQFKVEAFPTTFLYNSNGELEFTEVGYTTTAGLLGRMLLLSK